jgi:hypothetical protein
LGFSFYIYRLDRGSSFCFLLSVLLAQSVEIAMNTTLNHEALITLIEARCTLSSPDKWTKGSYARRKDEKEVSPIDPEAVKYCLEGAMWHSVYSRSKINPQTYCPTSLGSHNASDVLAAAVSFCASYLPKEEQMMYGDGCRIIHFNDKVATHEQILQVIDRGIIEATKAFEAEIKNKKEIK